MSVRVCQIVIMATLGVTTTVFAQSPAVVELGVRLYNVHGVATKDLHDARGVAGGILRSAGVSVSWRECRTVKGPSRLSTDRCAEELQPAEVLVELATAPPATPDAALVFGYSLVDTEKRRGTLSTILVNRIREAAWRAPTNVMVLLGRAIAHELGHLLLGTSTHAADGLMRAHWSDHSLRAGRADDWTFSPGEAIQLAGAVHARRTSAPLLAAVLPAADSTQAPRETK